MILGLHGKMGAGKNEAAKRLALLAPLPVVEVSFAAKLKESAAALLGCTVADLERWKNDPWARVNVRVGRNQYDEHHPSSQTVRSFLQRYGTEAHRNVFGQDFWLDAALPLDGPYLHALYVVTDVRFENEAKRVRALGGIVVGFEGPNDDTGDHPSETPLACDGWIVNTVRNDNWRSLDAALLNLLGSALDVAA